jgi:hypothetical protein
MKKNLFVLVLFCCLSAMAQAQVVKYCMSYSDFVAGNWKSVDELTGGRTKQACQMKTIDNQVRLKTGDKEADKILKKEVFAVMYGNDLLVNCHNLRNNDIVLDASGYAHAVRYNGDKLCVMAYKINDGAFLLGLGADVASFFTPTPVSIGLSVGSTTLWYSKDYLNTMACYLVESDANEKGKIPVTRINDSFMETLLAHDAPLLEKYKAISSKRNRQSAANILPVLMEKGVVKMEAIN